MKKHFVFGMLTAVALIMALVMGVVAVAENPGAEGAEPPAVEEPQAVPEIPADGEEAPAEAPEAPADGQQAAPADASSNTALQEALDAWRQARQDSRLDDLEAELSGYVESGKLTQEQADLILNYYKEQQALRNGTCPNCGYAFNGGQGRGKGGRMNGGKGGMNNGGMGVPGNGAQNNGGQFGGGMGGRQGRGGASRGVPAAPQANGQQSAPSGQGL